MNDYRIPNKDEIKQVFNEIHNVWLKKFWDAKSDEEFQQLLRDAHTIKERYPFLLTKSMLTELALIIELNAKEG